MLRNALDALVLKLLVAIAEGIIGLVTLLCVVVCLTLIMIMELVRIVFDVLLLVRLARILAHAIVINIYKSINMCMCICLIRIYYKNKIIIVRGIKYGKNIEISLFLDSFII